MGAGNDIWADEAEKIAAQRDQLQEERDLLASRLCAIAFEAGMGGARLRSGWDVDTGEFFTVLVHVDLSAEEVK